MEGLFLLLLIPLAWPLVAKKIWGRELTAAEVAINILVGIALSAGAWALGHYAVTHDMLVLNGQVVSKVKERVSCEHSYSCNCTQSCNGKDCTTTCQTCYEHLNDYSWLVKSDIGHSVEIDRVDRQGSREPPRFTAAKVGDPFATTESYTNYIKAAPHSLFHAQPLLNDLLPDVPKYPLDVYDYHYITRVLVSKVVVPETDKLRWNFELAQALKEIGPKRQANVVVVLAGHTDPQFGEAVQQAWLGGKKNDVLVVLGVPQYPKIAWARVYAWTDEEIFKVKLRDALLDLETADPAATVAAVKTEVIARYVRKPMKDFEYLKYEIELPAWAWACLAAFALIASVITSIVLARNNTRVPRSF